MSETDQVVIYTDGACKGNPGPGGWGALLVYRGAEKELWGGDPSTTNNRMELMAAIAGLVALTRPCSVKLVTDSQYVMKGIQEWLSFYYKAPIHKEGLKPEHDLSVQLLKLENTLRFFTNEEIINHLGLTYYGVDEGEE